MLERIMNFLKSAKVPGSILYECKTLSAFGTAYKKGQYVILPESTNTFLCLGKILKLLCCQTYGHLLYKRTYSQYCTKTDLFIVKEVEKFDVIPTYQVADPKPLQGYVVGEERKVTVSLRNFILEHI